MAVIDSIASDPVLSPFVGEVPDTGGTFATASVLGLDTPFQGTVTSSTDFTDAFRITANSAGILQIDLTGLGQNVSVLIYSANQRFVTAVYGGKAEGSLQANFQAEAGASYYIFVSIGSGTTAYNLNAGYSPFSGSDADDNFTGTLRGEMMAGYGGADTLNGLAGDDRLFGGDGDDALYGGAGNDSLQGQAGRNFLHGGTGIDFLYGGAEGDTLNGGDDNDFIYGGDGDDSMNGGEGQDMLSSGRGNDLMRGEAGADSLYSSDGNDTLLGGDGSDHLSDDLGQNLLSGEAGNDFVYGGKDADSLYGGTGGDVLHGNQFHDLIHGDAGDDRLYGGTGSDTLYGGSGNDQLVGNGSFAWFNGDGLNFLYGGDGADTLTGGEGRDVLDLGAADGDEDVIVVNDAAASRSDLRMDIVRNFESGIDYFDLYALDANPGLPGNQRFAWGETTATANGVWYQVDGPNVVLSFDMTGDAVADSSWRVEGLSVLTRDDFIL